MKNVRVIIIETAFVFHKILSTYQSNNASEGCMPRSMLLGVCYGNLAPKFILYIRKYKALGNNYLKSHHLALHVKKWRWQWLMSSRMQCGYGRIVSCAWCRNWTSGNPAAQKCIEAILLPTNVSCAVTTRPWPIRLKRIGTSRIVSDSG